ncbi:resolvase [Candidatus Aerophobetes bacterium]|uniref:Resolvase n=1 Tax=Aerophobetes bacterium TaxID=2030807 RepID=A0A2A4X883_UNCAE|nr:MAG: resolvase [Candidatus Aerophobetes bacterium]
MKIGYARVSSFGQSLDIQEKKLLKAGCEEIFAEKLSATSMTKREELDLALKTLRAGDLLIVTKLDRLARSMMDLFQISKRLHKKKANLLVLDQAINTTTAEGRLLFNVLGSFAEFENDIRKERQFDGIQRAKEKGVKFGRKSSFTAQKKQDIRRLRHEENFSIGDLQKKYACSHMTIYRILGEK